MSGFCKFNYTHSAMWNENSIWKQKAAYFSLILPIIIIIIASTIVVLLQFQVERKN